MDQVWSHHVIINLVKTFMENQHFDRIITFDDYGISGHINHRSIYNALKDAKILGDLEGPIFSLRSIPVAQKFASLPEALFTALTQSRTQKKLVLLSSPLGYLDGIAAMSSHRSQLVWYRYLYLIFSRYMFINVLDLMEAD